MSEQRRRHMTVLQLIPKLEVGGAERGTLDIAAALAAEGHRAIVASAGGRMVEALISSGAEHVSRPVGSKNPTEILSNLRWLSDFIQDVDIVHARSRVPAWIARIVTRRQRVPFVTTFHDAYAGTSRPKIFYNSVVASGDRVIAISRFVRDHILALYPQAGARTVLIPRGIDFSIFDPQAVTESRRQAFRASQNIPQDMPLVILPARLSPTKGHALTLQALGRLGARRFVCLMIGPDSGKRDYRERLDAITRDLRLTEKVRFVEGVDLPAAYACADLVLSPSQKAEGFGRVPVEAQAMGVPVIATALGATSETVLDGQTGWLIPFGDAAALAHAIERALSLSGDDRDAMAGKAMAHVRAQFDVKDMCSATLALYAGLLGE